LRESCTRAGRASATQAALLADYHLGAGSNATDAAVHLTWITNDIDDDPRPIGPLSDVGADERRMYAYLPLIVRDW
jgi:hypothetical protein